VTKNRSQHLGGKLKNIRLRAGAVLCIGSILVAGVSILLNAPPSLAGAATSTGSPIKIGVAVAQTGFNAQSTAASVPTIQAWAKWQNAQGGIGGHPVELVVQDTAGTPATAQSAITTLINNGVVAIYFEDAATETVVAPQLKAANIAVMVGQSYGPTVAIQPNFFSQAISAGQGEETPLVVAKGMGAKTISAAYCAEVADCATVSQLLSAGAPSAGITFAGGLALSASAPNYTAQCLSLKAKNTQSLAIAVAPQVATRLIADCVQQGYSPKYIITQGVVNLALYQKPVGVQYGAQLSSFPWWVNAAPVKTFRAAMKKYSPSTAINNTNVETAWESMLFFKAAVMPTVNSGLTKASVLAAFNSVKNQTLGGLLPQPISYTAGKPQAVVTCFWLFKYKSGAANPTLFTQGKSGNGATNGLRSSCLSPALVAAGGKP
jgi:branched-chain amino acid transport system substrate-binding protein